MLTTWRRLHIEVDSMGNANSNFVVGTITDTMKVRTGTVSLNLSVSNLEPNRFENGRLEIRRNGTVYRSLRVIDATFTTASPPVVITPSNTTSSVTIFNNTGTFSVANGDQFTLYDDDDMNDDDGTTIRPLHGDDGEDVSDELDTSLLTANSDDPSLNVLAPGYTRPVYDVFDPRDNSFFQANSFGASEVDIRALFLDKDYTTNTDDRFWTVYLLGSYQHTLNGDNDPNESESATRGIVDAITGDTTNGSDGEGSGALIFREVIRTSEIDDPSPYNNLRHVIAHEVGHLLGAVHTPQLDEYLLALMYRTHIPLVTQCRVVNNDLFEIPNP